MAFFFLADINQERIVEEGGLDALLLLLETSENTTIHRVTAGAVANLAMNGMQIITEDSIYSLCKLYQRIRCTFCSTWEILETHINSVNELVIFNIERC